MCRVSTPLRITSGLKRVVECRPPFKNPFPFLRRQDRHTIASYRAAADAWQRGAMDREVSRAENPPHCHIHQLFRIQYTLF